MARAISPSSAISRQITAAYEALRRIIQVFEPCVNKFEAIRSITTHISLFPNIFSTGHLKQNGPMPSEKTIILILTNYAPTV